MDLKKWMQDNRVTEISLYAGKFSITHKDWGRGHGETLHAALRDAQTSHAKTMELLA